MTIKRGVAANASAVAVAAAIAGIEFGATLAQAGKQGRFDITVGTSPDTPPTLLATTMNKQTDMTKMFSTGAVMSGSSDRPR